MLLSGYRLEIMKPVCNNTFESLHCIAHLNENISEVLPYLNSALGGDSYIKDPPSVTFKLYGKLITVHGQKIAVNALWDQAEACHILEWFKEQINQTWMNRSTIVPKFVGKVAPQIIEIYKLLPKNNCKKCRQPTCIAFASLAVPGIKNAEDCPEMTEEAKKRLQEYLDKFEFD